MLEIIEYYNNGCGACKLIKPILQELGKQYNINIIFTNVDDHIEVIAQMNLTSLPTVMFILDGVADGIVVERFSGYKPKVYIETLIKKYIKKDGN